MFLIKGPYSDTTLLYAFISCFIAPGVPYNVTLVAYNEFGRGMPVEVTVFTRVLSKYMYICSVYIYVLHMYMYSAFVYSVHVIG